MKTARSSRCGRLTATHAELLQILFAGPEGITDPPSEDSLRTPSPLENVSFDQFMTTALGETMQDLSGAGRLWDLGFSRQHSRSRRNPEQQNRSTGNRSTAQSTTNSETESREADSRPSTSGCSHSIYGSEDNCKFSRCDPPQVFKLKLTTTEQPRRVHMPDLSKSYFASAHSPDASSPGTREAAATAARIEEDSRTHSTEAGFAVDTGLAEISSALDTCLAQISSSSKPHSAEARSAFGTSLAEIGHSLEANTAETRYSSKTHLAETSYSSKTHSAKTAYKSYLAGSRSETYSAETYSAETYSAETCSASQTRAAKTGALPRTHSAKHSFAEKTFLADSRSETYSAETCSASQTRAAKTGALPRTHSAKHSFAEKTFLADSRSETYSAETCSASQTHAAETGSSSKVRPEMPSKPRSPDQLPKNDEMWREVMAFSAAPGAKPTPASREISKAPGGNNLSSGDSLERDFGRPLSSEEIIVEPESVVKFMVSNINNRKYWLNEKIERRSSLTASIGSDQSRFELGKIQTTEIAKQGGLCQRFRQIDCSAEEFSHADDDSQAYAIYNRSVKPSFEHHPALNDVADPNWKQTFNKLIANGLKVSIGADVFRKLNDSERYSTLWQLHIAVDILETFYMVDQQKRKDRLDEVLQGLETPHRLVCQDYCDSVLSFTTDDLYGKHRLDNGIKEVWKNIILHAMNTPANDFKIVPNTQFIPYIASILPFTINQGKQDKLFKKITNLCDLARQDSSTSKIKSMAALSEHSDDVDVFWYFMTTACLPHEWRQKSETSGSNAFVALRKMAKSSLNPSTD